MTVPPRAGPKNRAAAARSRTTQATWSRPDGVLSGRGEDKVMSGHSRDGAEYRIIVSIDCRSWPGQGGPLRTGGGAPVAAHGKRRAGGGTREAKWASWIDSGWTARSPS